MGTSFASATPPPAQPASPKTVVQERNRQLRPNP